MIHHIKIIKKSTETTVMTIFQFSVNTLQAEEMNIYKNVKMRVFKQVLMVRQLPAHPRSCVIQVNNFPVHHVSLCQAPVIFTIVTMIAAAPDHGTSRRIIQDRSQSRTIK